LLVLGKQFQRYLKNRKWDKLLTLYGVEKPSLSSAEFFKQNLPIEIYAGENFILGVFQDITTSKSKQYFFLLFLEKIVYRFEIKKNKTNYYLTLPIEAINNPNMIKKLTKGRKILTDPRGIEDKSTEPVIEK